MSDYDSPRYDPRGEQPGPEPQEHGKGPSEPSAEALAHARHLRGCNHYLTDFCGTCWQTANTLDAFAAAAVERAVAEARLEGLEEGITMYAWWRDGQQYVGTCGRTLQEALKEVRARSREEGKK
jgi:hypothetical protein